MSVCFFFFQAEDGIRDYKVTGVQTCALPISFEFVVVLAEAFDHGIEDLSEVSHFSSSARRQSGRQVAGGHLCRGARQARSEERRVGEEGRSRWSPYH